MVISRHSTPPNICARIDVHIWKGPSISMRYIPTCENLNGYETVSKQEAFFSSYYLHCLSKRKLACSSRSVCKSSKEVTWQAKRHCESLGIPEQVEQLQMCAVNKLGKTNRVDICRRHLGFCGCNSTGP
jgi:hypothetical protein